MDSTSERVENVVLVCIALHNYLRQTDSAKYNPSGFVDSEDSSWNIKKGLWREEVNKSALQNLGLARPRKPKSSATRNFILPAQYRL